MRHIGAFLALSLLAGLSGCEWMPGDPGKVNHHLPPAEIADFTVLFNQNCRGCHGTEGEPSSTIPMNDPLYLSILPKEQMRGITAGGVPKSRMPGFALENGGSLTDTQIDILVEGIYKWANKAAPVNPPPYSGTLGDPARGGATVALACASCHGDGGVGLKDKAGSIISPAYLGLVSDQYLRTIVIAGRSDLGCPDYLSRIPGRAMTNEEINDVVAWLVAQRKNEFGQPLSTSQN